MTAITIPNTFIPSTTISSTEMNDNFIAVAAAITASLALDGSGTMTAAFKASNGTAALPSISFGTDPNTGMYRRGNDDLAFAVGGAIRAHLNTTGLVLAPADVNNVAGANSITPALQVLGTSGSLSGLLLARYSAASAPSLQIGTSRNTTIGSHTIVASGEILGDVSFMGSDGTNFIIAAQIISACDGTPGANDMPGRLVFSTTPDGSASPSEAMRIDNAQKTIFQVDRALRFNNHTSAAGASAGTITNAPAAGNPTHWLKINIAGTNFAIPCWPG